MPDLKGPARRHAETARGVVPGDDGLIGVKTVTFPTAGLSSSQERLLLRKRFRSELEVVRGLLKKAEVLVAGKTVDGGAAPSKARPVPRRGKNGWFLPAEARPEADMACAKRRRTNPLVEVIEPRMSQDEREHLAGSLWSLSAKLPPHIVEFMQRQCSCDAGLSGGEMEIDLHSTGDAALFQLKKLLDQFAAERKQRLEAKPEPPKNEAVDASGAMSPSSPRQHEDGELAEEQEDMFVDICGDASPIAVDKVRCSSPLVRKDVEQEDEFVDICGDASPVAIEKFSEVCSSSSGSSSGSSCSASSDSDSDSDDDDSVCSSPAPAVLPIGVAARPLELQSSAAQDQKPQRAARPTGRITDLIARAQEEKRSKCRELDRKRAREELQEMERTALPSDSIHPRDMVLLGIAAVEYIVSSDDETSPVRSMWGKLRLGPGRGSLVQQLGLILKADYHGGEEEEQDLEGELR